MYFCVPCLLRDSENEELKEADGVDALTKGPEARA